MSAQKARLSVQRSTSRRSSVVLRTKTDNLDEILHEIGECSHYQFRRHVLFFLLSIPLACQTLLAVFAGQFPEICMDTGPKQCKMVDDLDRQKICSYSGQRQFRFLQQEKFSVVTEFELICDKSHLEQVANSVFFIGAFFGTIIIGWIAESFGRKPVMFCCLAIVSFTTTLSAIADSFWYFILARSLTGFFLSGIAVSMYVIASEIMGVSYRTTSDVFIWNYFSLGLMLLAMKAYFLNNWRHLQLVTTLPYLSVLACFRFVPESLRWLWRTGHYNRANKTVSTIAAENNLTNALTVFPDALSIESNEQEISCLTVLRHKRLLLYFSILAFITLVTGFIYYGLFLVSNYLSGNIYVDFVLMAAIEIPGNFMAILSIRRIGRRRTVGIGLLLTCILCGILCALIRSRSTISDWRSATLAAAIFCKLFLTTSMLTLVLWTKELHYLMGRSHRIDILNSFRPLGGAIAPWLTTFIIHDQPWMPFAIMCGLSGLIGLLSFMLPETKDIKTNYDEDDEDDDEESGHIIKKDSYGSSKDTFKGMNGAVDRNLNETAETNVSVVRKNNVVSLIDIKFDYLSVSHLDRETDI